MIYNLKKKKGGGGGKIYNQAITSSFLIFIQVFATAGIGYYLLN